MALADMGGSATNPDMKKGTPVKVAVGNQLSEEKALNQLVLQPVENGLVR